MGFSHCTKVKVFLALFQIVVLLYAGKNVEVIDLDRFFFSPRMLFPTKRLMRIKPNRASENHALLTMTILAF